MDINWFPGHMAKTLRQLREQLSRCDFILELCDARIPRSSRNPELNQIVQNKRRLLIMNKADLADPNVSEQWLRHYEQQGLAAVLLDARRPQDIKHLQRKITDLNRDILDRAKARGRLVRPIRCMVAGIPNCGKSTLINALCGKKSAKTANTPGVTRAISWLRAGTSLELMDSPGILWPKLAEKEQQIHLAATAAIKDDVLPLMDLAQLLLLELAEFYPQALQERYAFCPSPAGPEAGLEERLQLGQQALQELADVRKLYTEGQRPDLPRAARLLLQDFRSSALGRLSLERPVTSEQAEGEADHA